MAAKLTWEWGDRNDIIIRKKKGKITFDEVVRFLHERNMLNIFDGDLMVFQFRVSSEHELYDYRDTLHGEPEGDEIVLDLVTDEDLCPVCGEKRLFPQYCPDCGRKLEEPRRKGGST